MGVKPCQGAKHLRAYSAHEDCRRLEVSFPSPQALSLCMIHDQGLWLVLAYRAQHILIVFGPVKPLELKTSQITRPDPTLGGLTLAYLEAYIVVVQSAPLPRQGRGHVHEQHQARVFSRTQQQNDTRNREQTDRTPSQYLPPSLY
jgi:hypothetical protein